MKSIPKILVLICLLLFAGCVRSQTVCPDGSQCVKNETINKCADVAEKYKAALATIAAFQLERDASTAAITNRDNLIQKLKDVIAIDDQTATAKDKYIAILGQIDKLKDDLIAHLEKKLANNKSFLQKLLTKLQIAYYIVAGIAIVAK